jgi:hypothetical protein
MTDVLLTTGGWTRAERIRIGGILAVIAGLHVAGIALYLAYSGDLATAGGVAGTGVLAYVLGMRHEAGGRWGSGSSSRWATPPWWSRSRCSWHGAPPR